MDALALTIPNLLQLLPGLLAFGAAWLWLALRPVATGEKAGRPLGLWGALAGLVAAATPSVMASVIQFITLGRFNTEQRNFVLLTTLPATLLFLILALVVLVVSAAQRQDPLRRSFAAAALFGVFVRELLMLLFVGAGLVFGLFGLR
ncbi:hypothetical protein [Deinococcus frigens]|uniref:hypothetical protein n=1 Tax=Deinococcus frigens TaxID=249403 RepID=UPI0004955AF8|nr:hypothetical protein [Deinococcus frigens]